MQLFFTKCSNLGKKGICSDKVIELERKFMKGGYTGNGKIKGTEFKGKKFDEMDAICHNCGNFKQRSTPWK
jgi:hypothetical protein